MKINKNKSIDSINFIIIISMVLFLGINIFSYLAFVDELNIINLDQNSIKISLVYFFDLTLFRTVFIIFNTILLMLFVKLSLSLYMYLNSKAHSFLGLFSSDNENNFIDNYNNAFNRKMKFFYFFTPLIPVIYILTTNNITYAIKNLDILLIVFVIVTIVIDFSYHLSMYIKGNKEDRLAVLQYLKSNKALSKDISAFLFFAIILLFVLWVAELIFMNDIYAIPFDKFWQQRILAYNTNFIELTNLLSTLSFNNSEKNLFIDSSFFGLVTPKELLNFISDNHLINSALLVIRDTLWIVFVIVFFMQLVPKILLRFYLQNDFIKLVTHVTIITILVAIFSTIMGLISPLIFSINISDNHIYKFIILILSLILSISLDKEILAKNINNLTAKIKAR